MRNAKEDMGMFEEVECEEFYDEDDDLLEMDSIIEDDFLVDDEDTPLSIWEDPAFETDWEEFYVPEDEIDDLM